MNNDSFNDIIKTKREGGASFRQIAKGLRLSVGSVAGRCHRMGLCQPPEAHRERSRLFDDRIRVLAEGGARNRDIARELGVSIATVSSRTAKMDLADRRRRTPERATIRVRKPEPRVVEPVPEPSRAPDPSTAVAFTAAQGCRYALWSGDEMERSRKRVCGGQIDRGSYCASHASLVYVPYERRRAA